MIQNQLSKEQITQILEFVKSKYVRYKDVQFELVDHLASNIEERMINNTDLSFEIALKEAYSEFPITGFTKFVQSKTSALQKYWRSRFLVFIMSYFKLPKIIILLAISITLYLLFSYLPFSAKHYAYIFLGSFYISQFIGLRSHQKAMKERKLLLVEESYYSMITWSWFLPFMIGIGLHYQNIQHPWALLLVSLLCALTIIFYYGVVKAFPEHLKLEIEQKYAHLM